MRVKFYLRDQQTEGVTSIVAVVHFGGHRVRLGTGISLYPKYWTQSKGRARRGYLHERAVNQRLDEIEVGIVTEYMKLTADGARPTPEEFKARMRPEAVAKAIAVDEPEQPILPDVLTTLDDFIRESEATLRPRTLMIYQTLKSHLEDYQKEYKVVLTWDTLNLLFFRKFTEFLLRVKGNNNQTLEKTVQRLRAFLRHVDEVRGIPMCRDYLKYTAKALPKGEQSKKVYLSDRELQKLEQLDLRDSNPLQRVRDVFLFLARTGIRYGDSQLLRPEDLKRDHFEITTTKNRKTIRIPVHPTAARVWELYAGNLPKLSNQRFDQYLKEICQLAEIDELVRVVDHRGAERIEQALPKWKLVAAHTAKRSFITNLLLAGASVETVCEITGNSGDTIRSYIVPTGEDVRREVIAAWGKGTENADAKP